MAKLNYSTLNVTVSEVIKNADTPRTLVDEQLIATLEEVIATVLGDSVLIEIEVKENE